MSFGREFPGGRSRKTRAKDLKSPSNGWNGGKERGTGIKEKNFVGGHMRYTWRIGAEAGYRLGDRNTEKKGTQGKQRNVSHMLKQTVEWYGGE